MDWKGIPGDAEDRKRKQEIGAGASFEHAGQTDHLAVEYLPERSAGDGAAGRFDRFLLFIGKIAYRICSVEKDEQPLDEAARDLRRRVREPAGDEVRHAVVELEVLLLEGRYPLDPAALFDVPQIAEHEEQVLIAV